MKTSNGKFVMSVGLLLILGMLVSACLVKLNPEFRGSLTTALNERKADFKGCYERALARSREVRGDMKLILLFAPDSRHARDVQVVQTNIVDEQMKQCVRQAAMALTTPEPPGVPVDAQYTFNFNFR